MIPSLSHKRKAFSMITAIFVILLMATVAGFIMNLSGKITQETTSQYRKEQAILLAKSYTEFAIMAATAQDCVRPTITADVGGSTDEVKQGLGYRVTVNTQYIGNNSICSNKITDGGAITTPDSKNSIILIDTYVEYRDPDNPHAINNVALNNDDNRLGSMTYHRRTLQRL